jgi:hypothetical protein
MLNFLGALHFFQNGLSVGQFCFVLFLSPRIVCVFEVPVWILEFVEDFPNQPLFVQLFFSFRPQADHIKNPNSPSNSKKRKWIFRPQRTDHRYEADEKCS